MKSNQPVHVAASVMLSQNEMKKVCSTGVGKKS